MTKLEKFQKKYSDKGGIESLTEMRALCFRTVYIAKHFGVSADRVRDWMNEFFGETKDPREGRREEIIGAMAEFAKFHSKDEFDFAYRGTAYYADALLVCKQNGIYVA